MAVAVGVSAYADHQRQQAIERITELLELLHESKLFDERNALDGCRGAITKATALLLDKGRIGVSLGLDSAVHEIDKAIAAASRRLKEWQAALEQVSHGRVELGRLRDKFKGIGGQGGEFQTQLELAMLAIALKRRVIVIQAVDHAQMDNANQFESFVSALQDDSRDVDELELGIASVLRGLSSLELSRRGGIRDLVLTPGEVDDLLQSAYRLRALGERLEAGGPQPDVAIDIVRSGDGSVVVLPARPAA
jgi:prefoldin subunit 5